MTNYIIGRDGELYHYGIKGMKWGRRRFETSSGHLTPAGKARYDHYNETRGNRKVQKYQAKAEKYRKSAKEWDRAAKSYKKSFGSTDDTTLKSEQYAYSDKRKAKKYEAKAKEAERLAKRKMEAKASKQSYKKAVEERAAQINKDSSTVGRMYNNLTGAHKTQAKIELDIEKRSRTNKVANNQKQRDPEVVAQRKATAKKVAKGAAVVAGTAIAAYGASKLIKSQNSKIQIRKGEEEARKYLEGRKVEHISTKNGITTLTSKKVTASFTGDMKTAWEDFDNRSFEGANRIRSKAREEASRQVTTREAAANIAGYYRDKRRSR